MKLTTRQRTYWRLNLYLTAGLLAVWFGVTMVTGYFARPLNEYTLFGFPLAFYIFSQGALLVFLLIVGVYVWIMNRLDRRFGVAEHKR